MSHTLETVVRPFQTRDVTPPTVVPYAQPTTLPLNVKLQIGRIGATRTFHGTTSVTASVYDVKYPTETTST